MKAYTDNSYLWGPYMMANSFIWSQYIIPTTVGTVMVTVNEANNQTWSSTRWHTEYMNNDSITLVTRTDTNAAGTVTAIPYGINITV